MKHENNLFFNLTQDSTNYIGRSYPNYLNNDCVIPFSSGNGKGFRIFLFSLLSKLFMMVGYCFLGKTTCIIQTMQFL